MNYLTLENVTKSYGEKILFKNVDLTIEKGQKIALVAKNGTGKSTLLRVLSGEESAEGEQAKILIRKDIRIGYLKQDPQLRPEDSVIDSVLDSDFPHIKATRDYEIAMLHPDQPKKLEDALHMMDELKAWDFEARIHEILSKLGLNDVEQKINTMSGGQVKRVALAKILIEEPDFFILDEPTNHLDIEMIEWLESYLNQPNITLFMVTHDRYFLDNVCDHILELQAGVFYKYKGNYSDYLEKKAIREEVDAATFQKNKKLFKRELEWMRRTPEARTTKAKSRIDDFYEIKDKVTVKKELTDMSIDIKSTWLGGKTVECQYISKKYGKQIIVENFHYNFKRMDRVGIVGPNGIGKSTLLRMITGEERPDAGKVVIGETVKFGHYTQSGITLKEDKRVIEVITDIAEYIPLAKGQKLTAGALLERFLFSRDQQQVYVSQLSGGEKRRLYLLTVIMENPNFLILDEPTNDLDILTLNVLEEFLDDFPGCLIVVTHDRYFMDKIVDHIFVLEGEGKIKDFNGNYTEYRVQRKLELREQKQNDIKEKNAPVVVKEQSKLTYTEKKEMDKVEKEIKNLEKKRQAILDAFATGNLSGTEATQHSKDLAQIQQQLDDKEMRWLELSEKG